MVHYPTPAALAAGALALDEVGDRYLVAPVDQPHEEWLAALDAGWIRHRAGLCARSLHRLSFDCPR